MRAIHHGPVFCSVLAFVLGCGASRAPAQPTGGQVVAGAATFSTGPGGLTITQTSGRAVINWQDFSIAAGDFARFVQPDAASATLNRVVSGLPSSVLGSLEANGRVFLINPNGILIGAGARIDTGGFLASTLDVANQNFLAGGDLKFSGDSTAAVQNLGTINALGGDVFLIARRVENTGTISAANGTAGLAAGSEVLLTTGGRERVFVQAGSAPGTLTNAGTVTATTAELKAAGGNAYALAINHSGTVRATGSEVRDGQVWLVATGESTVETSGTLDASSATGSGGKIAVTGGRVLLADGARIDASGATGGGEILVFGGAQAGGQVAVGGTLDARATGSGDGGFIETSAARVLVTEAARVTTTAADGHSGTWLIDPVDFTIAATGGDMTGTAVGTALAGGNFTIQSTAGSAGTAGNVNVNAPVSWSANKLTLNAQNNIVFNSVLTGSGTASLALQYGQGAVAAGNTSDYLVRAAINLPAGNNLSTKLGSDGAVKNYTVITSLGAPGSTTATDLQGMNGNRAGLYALGADIDASATSGWNAGAGFATLGSPATPFTGILEGLGHIICDLTINRPGTTGVGLFGTTTGAFIRNLGLECGTITGAGSVGSLVGGGGGTIFNSYSNATVTGSAAGVGGLVGSSAGGFTIGSSYATGVVSGGSDTGGLIGTVTNGTITNSYATGTVTGANQVGGVAGHIDGGSISGSYATGTVSATGTSVGGLVGLADSTVAISKTHATSSVSGASDVGGLIGYADSQVTIGNSYATGNVTTTTGSGGGLVGHLNGEIAAAYATGNVSGGTTSGQIGGLVGFSSGTVDTSYAAGAVTSSHANVGALVGDSAGSTVNNSFWNTQVSGQALPFGGTGGTTGNGATGLTTVQMRTAASFTGFTFTTTTGVTGNNWVIVNGAGTLNNAGGAAGATYPMLASEYSTTINSAHQLQLVQMAPAASYTLAVNIAALPTGSNKDVWGTTGFVPLQGFTGTFDGLGRTVSNLTINRPTTDNVGLFATVTGSTISNLGLMNPSVTGQQQVGALIGLASGGTVNTSFVIGGTVTGTTDVGGMIGQSSSTGFHPPLPATVNNSYTSNTTVSGTTNVGGLVGYNRVGSINRAYSAATVSGTTNIGELVGKYENGSLSDSFWNKTLKATGIGSDALPGATTGATGMTTAELQQQLNFTSATGSNGSSNPAWDFAANWVMYNGNTAPLLRVFMKPLTVTANNATKTYNGLAYSGGNGVTYFCCADLSLLFGTLAYSGSSQGAVNVGAYAITPSGLYSNQQGYILTFASGSLTVNKANLTLSGTRAYDSTTIFAGTNLTATGVNGETFTVGGAGATGNLTTKNVQTNQLLANLTGLTLGTGNTGAALAANYNSLSTTGSSVSVTPANLTLSGTRVYNGLTSFAGSNLTATGVNGETFTMTGAGATGNLTTKNVQTSQPLASVAGLTIGTGNTGAALASNYNLGIAGSSVNVTRADLTLTGSQVYNGLTAFAGSNLTATGVNGETFAVTGAGAAGNLASKDVQTGTALATTTGLALGTSSNGGLANNYNPFFQASSSVSITKANLTLSGTRVYNGTTTFAASDLGSVATGVNGETFALTGAGDATNLGDKNVQTGALASVSGLTLGASSNGGLLSNYNLLAAANSTISITKADLTLTGTRVYNGATAFAASDLSSIATGVNGETFALTGSGTLSTKNVQTSQPLTSVAGLTLGAGNTGAALATNYNALAPAHSSVSVTKAPISITSADVVKTYDGTLTAAGSPVILVGQLFGSDVLTFSGLGPTYQFVGTGVGTGKTVTVSGISVNDGNNGQNYTRTLVNNTTSTINPYAVNLSASRVYNGTTSVAANLFTFGTLVGTETLTLTGTGAVTSKDVGTGKAVTGLTLADGTGLASNYTFTGGTQTASITKADLTLSGTRVYNGTTLFAGTNLTATGVAGETFALTGAGDATNLSSKDVQSGPLASVTGLTLGTSGNGGLSGNYNSLSTTNSAISVTKANLTLTGTRVYDGTTTFAASDLSSVATGVNGETFTLTGSGTLSTKNVQTTQPLATVTGLTLGAGNTGAAVATNYNALAAANSSVSVTKAPLTVSTANVVKTYDGTTTAAGAPLVTVGTLFAGDTLAGGTFAFSTKDVGNANKTVTVAGVTVNDANTGQNYTLTLANNTTSTINPFAVNLSASRVYNGTTAVAANLFTFGTLVGTETLTLTGTGAVTSKDVGTGKAVTGLTLADGTGLASNYTFTGGTQTASITKADLTLSGTRVYNGTTLFAGTNLTATGVAGETFALTGAGDATNLSSKDVQSGTLASVTGLTLGTSGNGGLSGNYNTLSTTNSAISVTKADLTLTGTQVYNGLTAFAGTNLTATGVNGETFAVTGAGATGNLTTKNVQTNQLLASVAGLALGAGNTGAAVSTNYTALGVTNSSVSVTPRALTITGFASNDKTYDGLTAAVVATPGTLAGVVSGDNVSFTHTGATFATPNVGTGLTTTLNGVALTGGDRTNYTYTAVTTDPSAITAATLTYTATPATRLYGATNPAFTGTVTGFVNGETLLGATTGTAAFTTTATPANNVGTYALLGSGLTANHGNYVFVQAAGNATAFSITPAPLTITADNKTKVYGAALPTFTATYTGLVNGDSLSVVTGLTLTGTATAASNVGTTAITAANGTAANYTITHAPGTLTITPAPLTITADNKSRAFGVANPVFTATYTGLVNSDTSTVVSGLALATTAVLGSPIGNYPITASGATAGNYAITFVDGLLAVGQNLLTITADNKTKTYGAALPAFTATYTGLLNGDTSSVVTGLQFNTTALASSNVGTYTITPFGGTATSYTLAYVSGQLTINPAALTITATNATRLYGAANPTFAASFAGLVNGDTSTVVTGLTFATPATTLSNVGSYAITPLNGTAANYTITHTAGALSVTPAPLTIAADNKTKLYGATLPTFTATYTGLVNGDASSVVTGLTLTTPATAASNVGTSAITAANGTATNYTITHAPGALSITPAPLTIAADNKTKLYGATLPSFTATYTGLVNGDASSVVTGLTLTTPATAASNVGTAAITAANGTASNYTITHAPGALSITPAPLTIAADNKTKVYGATLPTFTATYTGLVNSDASSVVTGLTLSSLATAATGVGTSAITPANATAANYTITHTPGALTITPAPLTIAADNKTKVYGATLPTFTATYTGLVNGDASSVVTGLTLSSLATAATGVGTFAITPANATAANYTITHTPGALTITPAPLTITADNKSRAVGAADPVFTATYTGLVNSDPSSVVSGLALTTTALTNSPIGNYPITPSGATAGNYAITFVNGLLTIGQNLLTITADNKTKSYGAALPTFTASYAGLLNGDTSSVVTGLQFNTTALSSSNVGTYTITPFGGTATSYTLAYVSGQLTINPAALTITATNATRLYGAANPAFAASYAGLVNGDTSAVVTGLTLTTPAIATSNVGSYAITPSNATAANYTITHAPGALNVTPAPLTIAADNKTKVYGAALPAFTATYTGLVNGDASSVVTGLTLTSTATAASNVGTTTITAANGTATNYTITHTPGALTITPAPLTITADNKSRAVGAADPVFTATYTGLVNNDPSSVVTGLSLTTTALTSSPLGNYPINAAGATAANYTITHVPGLLTIGQNLLTISANNTSKTYGAPLPAFSANYSGFVNGDTSAVVTGLQFSTTASASSNVGTYTITPFGATAPTYTLAYVSGLLTINPASLVITANNATRLYGAANPAFAASFAGLVNGDTSSVVSGLSISTPATPASNVGSYAITPANATAANYAITHVPGALSVTPAPLTIAADNKSRAFGLANPPLTATYTGFVNGDTASVVSGLSLATTAVTTSPAGNYPITAAGATAANYALTFAPGTLAITPAALNLLTITANNLSKTYGAPLPAFTASYAGLLNGDSPSVVTGLQFSTTASATSNVGTYAITPFGATAPSYTLAYVPGLLTINPANLLIAADNQSRTFGAANPTLTARFTGFVNGDTASVVSGLALSTPATPASPVGTYAIAAAGATAANYAITFSPGALAVGPAALTITADNKTKTYGAPLPTFTASFAGFLNGDTSAAVTGLQFSTTASATSNVGTFAITPFGATVPNYSPTYVPGLLTINPAALSITANNAARTYGAGNPPFSATFAGLVNGDSSSVVTGLTFTTPATAATGIGNYAITPGGTTAPNYALTFVPGTLTINRASLTLTASSASRDFGAPNPPFTGSFAGFVNGDSAAVVSGLTFSTPANATSPAGDYAVTPSGATAANYTFTFVNGTLRVIAPTVTVGPDPRPVVTVNDRPAVTTELAVVNLDGRLVLVPVDPTAGRPVSLDGQLALSLSEATTQPSFMSSPVGPSSPTPGGTPRPDGPNFGNFELLPSLASGGGGVALGGGGGVGAPQLNEPGVYRESTINLGGFNVVYHEAVADARQQTQSNTALGSSYREFSEDENPQINHVRAKVDRKPADSTGARAPGGVQ